jgi:hypothetical protein
MNFRHISKTDAASAAAEGFVFGYPLVLMDRVRQWMTAVPAADPTRMQAPLNQFVHAHEPPGATAAAVPSPYADTLRSSAWLDLDPGPILLDVPETYGRFYVLSLVDLWSNVFACVGARTTGSSGGTYAICGPRWRGGDTTAGALPIAAPTRFIRIAGQTQVSGDEDRAAARAVQERYRLNAAPGAEGTAAPTAVRGGRTPPVEQVERMDATTFFSELTRLMRDNPPRLEDRPVVDRIRAGGLLSDDAGSWERLAADIRRGAERGVQEAMGRIVAAAEAPPGDPLGDWWVRFGIGAFGTDYLSRAAAACAGLEGGPAGDELPALVRSDHEGRPLTGRHRYMLRFPSGRFPPVHGFWTLTTYDDRQPLVDNPADRYSIGDWNGLTVAHDGSLTIHVQHARPGEADLSNWLPSPPGAFNMLLRLVWPQDEALRRAWTPPSVVRVD